MKLIYRLAGALIGGLKGILIAPTLPWIITGKDFVKGMAYLLFNFARDHKNYLLEYIEEGRWGHLALHTIGLLLIVAPMLFSFVLTLSVCVLVSVALISILVVPVGCIFSLYLGFIGGLFSNEDKKAPAMNVYQVLRANYYIYYYDFEVADFKDSIKNYLTRKYHGFSDMWHVDPNPHKVVLIELLQDPKYAGFVKDVLAHITCADYLDKAYPPRFFQIIEYIDIKNTDLLKYLLYIADPKQTEHRPTAQASAKRFLMYILNQQLIAPTDMPDNALLQEFNAEMLVNFIKGEILTPSPSLENTDLGDFCHSKLYDQALLSNQILAFFDQRGSTKHIQLDPHECQNNLMLI
ncbi:MAG: hypothetical protein H0U75_10480 [Legionella sp.]|nr:hypothetical protein [Legionella sp.]